MRRLAALGCAVALGIASASAATDRAADYAAVATIAASSPDGLQRLDLPLPMLQRSRAGLADLRVFNAKGESLPLALVAPRAAATTREAALPLFAWPAPAASTAANSVHVQVDAGGAVVRIDGAVDARGGAAPAREWLLDASARGEGERLAAITLGWEPSVAGVTRGAALEGSDDLAHWRPLVRATLVDLVSDGGARVRRDRIAIDGDAPKYLRLKLDGALPLRVAHAQWRGVESTALDRAKVAFERPNGDAPWQLDLQAPIALRRLAVTLPQPNTVAVITLEQRNDGDRDWRVVGRHTLYRLTRNGEELAAPPIEIAAAAARHWRLAPDANATLAADRLDAEIAWPRAQVVFVARGPLPLRLAVGRAHGSAVALPLATLIPGYRAGDEAALPQATLGALVVQTPSQPGWIESLRDAGPEQQRRWLLWFVLAAAVGALAWLARGLFRDLHR